MPNPNQFGNYLKDRRAKLDRCTAWPLRVVEMTGAPGDVWLMDLRTFHSASPNAAEVPRVMVTQRFVRRDIAREFAEAHGWLKSGGQPGEAS